MLVNYNALSPATIKQLAKMGVNRPKNYDFLDGIEDEVLRQSLLEDYQNGLLVAPDDNASDDLMALINAYKTYGMGR